MIMKGVRAMLLYLENAPRVSFNPQMRFYMVTASNKPLPLSWLEKKPGDILTIERILSLDIPDKYGFLTPWGRKMQPIIPTSAAMHEICL